MTLSEGLTRWLKKKGQTWSPRVAREVGRMVEGWLKEWGSGKEIGSVSALDVERVEAGTARLSGSRANQVRTYLGAFLKWAREVGAGPPEGVMNTWRWRRAEVRREYAPPTREEEERLVRESPEWLGRFIRFALCTGLRVGTIRQLDWGMVREEGERWVVVIPAGIMKQRVPHRVVLSGKARVAIGERGTGRLIPMPETSQEVYREFKRAVCKTGVNPAMSPHDLKRGFVQRLSAARYPLQTIMRLVGNSTPGVLIKHYTGPVPVEEAGEAMEKI